jgi:signal peptidase I
MSPAVETGRKTAEILPSPLLAETLPKGVGPASGESPAVFGLVQQPSGTAAAIPLPAPVHRHGLLQAFQSLVYIIVVALFIITFTVQPFRIPSESMEPTLLVGDFLLVNKEVSSDPHTGVIAPTNLIHRGDLVVFRYPVEPSLHLVKRVVGLPGDHLRLRDGHVYINGRSLSEPYAIFRPSAHDSYRDDFPRMSNADPGVDSRWWIQMHSLVSNGELVVPANSYFVLGDNRNDSEDSRYWGFVPRAAIVGKPFLIYFSLRGLDKESVELPAGDGRRTADRHDAPLGSLVDLARWDRALHIIY